MTKFLNVSTYLVLCVGVALTGCTNLQNDVNHSSSKLKAEINESRDTMLKPVSAVQRTETSWFAGERVEIREPYPQELRASLKMQARVPVNLWEIGSRVAEATSIPVRIDPDVYLSLGDELDQSSTTDSTVVPIDAPIASAVAADSDQGMSAVDVSKGITYDYFGTLHGFLDVISARYGVSWSYNEGEIIVSRRVTKVFHIAVMDGASDIRAAVGGAASPTDIAVEQGASAVASTSSGDDVVQSQSYTVQLDLWNSIVNGIRGQMSTIGEIEVSPSTGSVTVIDIPFAVRRVSEYVKAENESLTRQIHIEVTLISVTNSRGDKYGVNWEALYSKLDSMEIAFGSPESRLGTDAAEIVLSRTKAGSKFNGTEAVIQALSEDNQLSLVRRTVVRTLNNRQSPIQLTATEGYLKQVETTVTESTATESLIPGSFTSGVVMQLRPRLLQDDNLLMMFNGDVSELLGFTRETSGDNSISIPNYVRRSFSNEVLMRSGEVLLLNLVDSEDNSADLYGLGHAANSLAGGRDISKRDTSVLILVRPVVMGGRYVGRQS